MLFNSLLNPGHSSCAGCGEILAMRHVLDAAGSNTIIVNATGCSEVTTSKFPTSSFKVPWIHANFENASAVAAGVWAALKTKRKILRGSSRFTSGLAPQDDKQKQAQDDKAGKINVMAWGGDGAFFDIGFGLLSGSWERGENILHVCFDNEAYMNTGVQASGATPFSANTTTTPPDTNSFGNELMKKDMIAIALAHRCVYAGTATIANVVDIENKVKKALTLAGPKYLQILVTCVPGWYTDAKDTIKIARLAQQTGVYPVVEFVNGELLDAVKCPVPRPKVEEYLKLQGRYKHLFKSDKGQVIIKKIQSMADENMEKYNLQ
ncbi:pyruvate ferredoxin oxidoreductase [Candidatus Falkowbacteria bacterium]|nr:pyruvate ferredoxin oxidoreductase [Candidatus Falkowbacteria bacterium]